MSESITSFKQGDRVKRSGTNGPLGTVKQVRIESVRQSLRKEDGEPPGITVTVLWDSGTLSHFIPEGLDIS